MGIRLTHRLAWVMRQRRWRLLDGLGLNPERRAREGLSVVNGEGMGNEQDQKQRVFRQKCGKLIASYPVAEKDPKTCSAWCRRAEALGATADAETDAERAAELLWELKEYKKDWK